MINKIHKITLIILTAAVFLFTQQGWAFAFQEGMELDIGKCIDIVDHAGEVVSKVARQVAVGDEVITCDGKHYRINRVSSNRAEARLLGYDKDYLAWCSYFKNSVMPVAASNWKNRPVAVYHTHSDESYLPTDGHSSIPFKGGIYQVGERFYESIKNLKVKINYDRTPHDPHDNMAYVRSRRTAVKLMKDQPAALFDVHRDGIPDPNFYRDKISGDIVSRVRLVIGRQNPKKSANLDFAKRLMAYANEKHPKVVKEIFIGNGNYNQDLMSTALLIEAGTYTNSKENAEDGVSFLAEAVPVVLGLTGTAQDKSIIGDESEGRHWWVLIMLIVIITLVGGAFVFLNTANSQEVLNNAVGRVSEAYKRIRRR